MRTLFRSLIVLTACAVIPACNQNQTNGPTWEGGPTVGSNAGGTVVLNWSAAIDNSGTGITYAVYQSNSGSGTEDTSTPVGGTPTAGLTATIGSLLAANHYWFIVVASDGNGNTATSTEIEVIAN